MWSTLTRGEIKPENKRVAIQACELLGYDFDAICTGNTTRACANDLEFLRMPVSSMNDAVIEEINACLACTGRATGLTERLAAAKEEVTSFAP